ncbi:MAG: MATE family efflux transporter [Gemmatimonadaceae bacterium]|nr:MATE family efflux transporter [Gemmatimonadaceae bacterium]
MTGTTRTTPETTTSTTGRLISDVRDALRGRQHDYTSGPIGQAIFLLAIPMVLEMVMESLFALSDVFFVARLGATAVATVGLTESMMIVVYTLAMGLSISGTAVVARRIGEKDADGAGRAAVQAILLGALIATLIAIAGAVFAPTLLRFMGAGEDVVTTGTMFTRVMLGGSVTAFLLFVVNATFRGAGDAAVSMRVMWLANGINIALGPLLIFGIGPFPTLGVTGAALATTIGRGTGLLYALYRLTRGTGNLRVRRSHVVFEPRTMLGMLRLSVNGTFQVLVGSLSWIVLVRLMAVFGSAAMAGYTIAVRMVMFAMLPAWGLGNAAATMVGQALGAGNPDRAEKAVWTAARYNVAFLGIMGAIFAVFAPWIVSAFTSEIAVSRVAVDGLRVMAFGFPLFAFGMVLTQSFNGAGDTSTPTRINIGVFWLFEIPLAWVLARQTSLGFHAIFVSISVAYSVLAAVSWFMFRRGTWRTRTV